MFVHVYWNWLPVAIGAMKELLTPTSVAGFPAHCSPPGYGSVTYNPESGCLCNNYWLPHKPYAVYCSKRHFYKASPCHFRCAPGVCPGAPSFLMQYIVVKGNAHKRQSQTFKFDGKTTILRSQSLDRTLPLRTCYGEVYRNITREQNGWLIA